MRGDARGRAGSSSCLSRGAFGSVAAIHTSVTAEDLRADSDERRKSRTRLPGGGGREEETALWAFRFCSQPLCPRGDAGEAGP